jgi:hypothetical protein
MAPLAGLFFMKAEEAFDPLAVGLLRANGHMECAG